MLGPLRANRNVVVRDIEPTDTVGELRVDHAQKPFDNSAILCILARSLDQASCMTAVAGDDPALWRAGVSFFTPAPPWPTMPAPPP